MICCAKCNKVIPEDETSSHEQTRFCSGDCRRSYYGLQSEGGHHAVVPRTYGHVTYFSIPEGFRPKPPSGMLGH